MSSYSLTWGALWAASTMCAAWCAALLVEAPGTSERPEPHQPRMALAGLTMATLGVVIASCAINGSTAVARNSFLWQGLVLVASVAGLLPAARRLGLEALAAAAMLPTVGTAIVLGTWQQTILSVAPSLAGAR